MKDEIREILDRLERIDHKDYIAFEFADSATFDEMARCFEERKKLADCITNLQERIDKAIEYIENNSLYDEILDYDYEENPYVSYTTDEYAKENLLNILQGKDKGGEE